MAYKSIATIKRKLLLAGLIAMSLILSGCASLKQSADYTTDQNTPLPQQAANLEHLNHWLMRGKLLITDQLKKNTQTAQLYWKQQSTTYHIQLSGPAGFGRIILKGDDTQVTVKNSDGEQRFDSTAQALHYYQLPPLAIEHLRYWILGLASPLSPVKKNVLRDHQLLHLEQAQWSLDFSGYTQQHNVALPTHIQLHNEQYRVTLSINQWELQ